MTPREKIKIKNSTGKVSQVFAFTKCHTNVLADEEQHHQNPLKATIWTKDSNVPGPFLRSAASSVVIMDVPSEFTN